MLRWMKDFLIWAFKGLDNFKETRIRLVTENDPEALKALLKEIADRWGDTPPPPATDIYHL